MTFETDHLGFLLNPLDWQPAWAEQSAEQLDIALEAQDLAIIESLRNFYFEFDLSPPMRPLVKHIKNNFGADIGNSIWLMQRYGESPARTLALLSGLPKPKNCL
ncbi:TusE/DsrC/DsvC family sulfur relay protein [Reinekea thalattae]|uniref:Sulfurtransferase n=1 Tax=Reinekea thalattae TaxID=2593301 RepID=A0A5C8Z896_9GAMM|nr:TusE/DsrC/DsvC family sulfur relay protein [Reinekea thalattae]TXR53468.1 TusE/DsrC/DsvC family sulfur relay protein [Reinekea thalattae]